MNKKQSIMWILAISILLPIVSMAQVKIGYIASERVRTEYEEFKEAESQLQLEFRKVQFEYQDLMIQLDSLKQSYETQRLMSSPDWRAEKEQEIQSLELEIQNFQAQKVGPEGELYQRQAQMEYELLGKVKQAVDRVAIDKGYDFIFDGSVSLLYGKATFDLTDDVLHELKKANESN
ncbi:MAG: OmpH family outer membrane protein [Candidatus Marinimicrobia bacterium]|nr:OmpH family outer membrane protein [Candidatus Neomarinimicrobiota bacterium]MBL7059808.1 OmpH family outer membrane protein [Candidatus Neomarinimicrobiota bacterium]